MHALAFAHGCIPTRGVSLLPLAGGLPATATRRLPGALCMQDRARSTSSAGTRNIRPVLVSAALVMMLSLGGMTGAPSAANAELVFDKAGNAYSVEKICPWATPDLPGCPICPIPYFPCWQEGYFCFRPIYCQGKFSPEGLGNAAIILGGVFGPLYNLYSRKKKEAYYAQNPQDPEAIAYFRRKEEVRARANLPTRTLGDSGGRTTRSETVEKKAQTSFFSRNIRNTEDDL
mmetsp:Transcript_67129/g.98217  ORF Transcript_67129/g.98217 Transcript_67129/m.98217 type:complete len:231 (+) Transcript_67129:61-753(+)